MGDAATETTTRDRRSAPCRHWFLVNFGILYGIAFVATSVEAVIFGNEPPHRAWVWGVPFAGLLLSEGQGSWWSFGIALASVAAAASLVRV